MTPPPTPPRSGEGSGISPLSRFGKGAGGLGLRSHALGILICFQLLYLPAANFIKLVALRLPESKGELDDDIQLRGLQFPERVQVLADAAGTAFVRWGELTGQAQGWSLFAPIFGHQASLPMVSFTNSINAQTPVLISSIFRPENPDSYMRFPSTNCRLFNFEYRLTLLYWTFDREWFLQHQRQWWQAAEKRVRRQNRSLQSYMSWKIDRFNLFNPRKSLATITLDAEMFTAPSAEDPGSNRDGIQRKSIALWVPSGAPKGMLPIQAFDLRSPRFWVWLPIEDEP